MSFRKLAAAGLAVVALAGTTAAAGAQEVNVYSLRQPFLVEPLFEAFTAQTGIDVNVIFAKKGVLERIKREGRNSPADVILTVDIGRLSDAVAADLVQKVDSPVLNDAIPAQYRAADGSWFALTTRARIIYASKDRVQPGEVTRYEDLADPKWRGRICTRSGTHSYQVALTASMIAALGEEGAEAWLRGMKENLARKPQGNDRAQVKAIKEGQCDLSLGNSYYYGKMLEKEDQQAWAQSVYLIFPNQQDRGTHVNISGMAMAKNAPNRASALKLMEFLASPEAQRIYAEVNYEYPVVPGVPWSDKARSWGAFTADSLRLETIAELRSAAIRLTDKIGYNE